MAALIAIMEAAQLEDEPAARNSKRFPVNAKGVRNALHALPQTERLKLFKRADFMERWLQGINTLIEELSRIRDKFLDML